MRLPLLKKTWEATNIAAAKLISSNLVLALIALAAVLHAFSIKERVVLVPAVLDKSVSVGWESAQKEYLEGIGLTFAILVGNITPGNATFVADTLSLFVHSSIYSEVRKKIFEAANNPVFRNSGGSTRYDPEKVFFEAETKRIFVLGKMRVTTAATLTGRAAPEPDKPLIYEVKIQVTGGRPWIMAIDSYEGTEPHTLKWKEAHPEPEKKTSDPAVGFQQPEIVQ
jgi:conjugal transfer pilus assembly protein TraE